MTLLRMLVALAALVASSVAFAETDCTDPIARWKPRELLAFDGHMLSRLMPIGQRWRPYARAATV